MLLVLAVAVAAAYSGSAAAGEQPGRQPVRFAARWVGQDEQDFVGPYSQKQPSGVQDVHVELEGLDPRHEVVFAEVAAREGDIWRYAVKPGCWRAELLRQPRAPSAGLYIEPSRVEVGRLFKVVVRYANGLVVQADLRGGTADPNLRMPGNELAARWVGQDGADWTGAGPSVGPDGLQDVHIHLSKLAAKLAVKAVRAQGPAGARWEQGTNLRLSSNAELVRDAHDPSQAELYFQPDRDLNGQSMKVAVAYDNGQLDATTLIAGLCDPALSMPASPMPVVVEGAFQANWVGQDDGGPSSPGDVRVAVTGLPAALSIVGAVLTDSVHGTWIFKSKDGVSIPTDPTALPLVVKVGAGGRSADLFFAPYRDESKATLTLRLIAADGRSLLARFPGGGCDLGRRAPQPAASRTLARPGDDLQALVEQYGTVVLTRGTYLLRRPLVLERPVILTSEGGATLLFDQPPTEPRWTTAIKLHVGNTTLDGFAVRFAGPVRWNSDIAWGPAVIGMTDALDPPRDLPRVNVAFTHLDLEIPPDENQKEWVEAVRLMRLIGATSGVIAANLLRGGTIEFFAGPWRLVDNHFRGTPPMTFSHGIFGGHETHDLLVRGNRTHALGKSGKTWRFLALAGRAAGVVVSNNIIEGLGSRDGDTIPWSNEPEIILTENYHVRYEGKVMALANDGRVLRTGRPQAGSVRTGDVVSLLRGPAAGQWRQIVQALDSSTYLVEPPVPAGTEVVAISPGIVDGLFQENRIDIRGGNRSAALCFVGNHFGTRVIKNHLLGGTGAFKMTAYPTETPFFWGWSHAPCLGAVFEANIIEDAEHGGLLGVEHDARYIKSNAGRTYMTARLQGNVVRWSEPFARRMAGSEAKTPCPGITLGFEHAHDPGEFVVRADGNRLEAGGQAHRVPSLWIHAADYNGQKIVDRQFRLPSAGSAVPAGERAASKRPASDAR